MAWWMVWCGVAWCGMVWHGVMRCKVGRCVDSIVRSIVTADAEAPAPILTTLMIHPMGHGCPMQQCYGLLLPVVWQPHVLGCVSGAA